MKKFKNFFLCSLQVVMDLIFPRHCQICSRVMPYSDRTYLCEGCFQNIRFLPENSCIRCSKPLVSASEGMEDRGLVCPSCFGKKYNYDNCYAVCFYEGPVKELIHRFKFHRDEFLTGTLQNLFAEGLRSKIDGAQYDKVIPVPLHPRKLKERGFNQSELLARAMGKLRLGKICKNAMVRVQYSSGQTLQDRKSRIEKIRDNFRVNRPVKVRDQSVLLVDDVLTTGATIEECSRILKEAGARKVTVLVLARSI